MTVHGCVAPRQMLSKHKCEIISSKTLTGASLVVRWMRLPFQWRGVGSTLEGELTSHMMPCDQKTPQKQKQYCKKLDQDFKNCPHQKSLKVITVFVCAQSCGQEATVRTGTTDWFQIGKGVHQGCILSPCLFNLYAEYIMRNAGLEEA